MFEVEIGGKKVKADVTFHTGLLYEQEFHADIISDFYGVQDMKPVVTLDGENVVRADFTKVGWIETTKILWAAVKTADESAPSYAAWMKSTKGIDSWDVRSKLDEAITDCFFRSGAAEENAPE